MSAKAALFPAQASESNFYHPDDDVLPRNSPILAPIIPRLQPSPSPSPSPSPVTSFAKANPLRPGHGRPLPPRVKPSQADAHLLSVLDGGRHPEIAIYAGKEILPPCFEEEGDNHGPHGPEPSRGGSITRLGALVGGGGSGAGEAGNGTAHRGEGQQRSTMTTSDFAKRFEVGAFDLKSLAAGALAVSEKVGSASQGIGQATTKEKPQAPSIPTTTTTARKDDYREESRFSAHAGPLPYSPDSSYSPRSADHAAEQQVNGRSPPTAHPLTPGELPPIQLNSPRSDSNGRTPLPSIRTQLGSSWDELAGPAREQDGSMRHTTYSQSPPRHLPPIPSMPHRPHTGSPPVSPAETLRSDLPSPGRALAVPSRSKPYASQSRSNGPQRQKVDRLDSSKEPQKASQAGVAGLPLTAEEWGSVGSILTTTGPFWCKYPGCTASPFQTQYLLNSHRNVHSVERPHFCPVKGCARSEGGVGFKRKNEMIRHGLVHTSPGYVCPFCPDREHKYPRPDNLQRHVRVHHHDKDKDDPLLREVLSQRLDGPNRARRRRGLS